MIYIIGTMKSTDQRRNTTSSKTELNLSLGNPSCPTVEGICHWSVHPIQKSANVASAVSRTILNHRLLLCTFFTFCFIGSSLGKSTFPSNLAVAKGEHVRLKCSFDGSDKIEWDHNGLATKGEQKSVYTPTKRIKQRVAHLFSFDNSTNGQVDLIFIASESTSGRYSCIYIKEAKVFRAEVIVLDAQPECSKEVMSGFVKANCIIGYRGHWPPKLEWHKMSERLEANDTTKNENFDVASSLIVPFNEADPGPPYTLTCTPKFKQEDKEAVDGMSAQNVPEFPSSCTLTIGKSSDKEESNEQSKQPTSSVPPPSPPLYIIGIACVCVYVFPYWLPRTTLQAVETRTKAIQTDIE